MADTLITPLNDSFLDLDVLVNVDPETFEPTGISHYAEPVREARRQRRMVDGRGRPCRSESGVVGGALVQTSGNLDGSAAGRRFASAIAKSLLRGHFKGRPGGMDP
jgi:hypothetical protein